MLQTALVVDQYYTPLLFLFGTLGNSLSLLVFCMNAKYRSQSASYYLSALAISDTGFLVNLLAVWLEGVHGGVITSGLMCPLVMYLGQVTCFMSVYLTVAFSIERYVAVHYPLSRPRICTRSKARKAIAALTAIALLVFSYVWVIARVVEFPPKSDEYGEQYQDIFTTTNFTEDSQEEVLPFPGESREKDFIFSSHLPASAQFLTSNDLGTRNKDAFQQGENCGNGNYLVHNNSLNLRQQIESLNCSRMHLNEMTSRNSRHFFLSGELREESFFSVDNMFEVEKNLTADEKNFLSGDYRCSVPEGYYRISEIANYLDSVVTLIIPFFLITFFNVRIATCVWKLKDQRQSIVASSTAYINHHHSLRCSNKSSIHHMKNSKTPRTSPSTRQNNLSPQPQYSGGAPIRENGNGNAETDFENPTMYSKLQKGTGRRFKETCNKFTATGQSHNTTSSSSGSEENSQADNCGYDNNTSSTSPHFQNSGGNQGLNASARRLSTSDTLKASSKFLKKTSALGRFGAGEKINLEQRQKPLSTRVTIKPEFSVVRERISSHHPSSNAAEVRVTKTLLLVSTVFLVLNLPAHAIRCAHFIQSLRGTTEGQEFLQAAQAWTNILFNTNFAVNFLLYCVSGRNFRKSLKNIILRKFSRSSTSAWKSGKTRNTDRASYSVRMPGLKRNCLKELQVTEIVELEERAEDSVFPRNNSNTEDMVGEGQADEESMPV